MKVIMTKDVGGVGQRGTLQNVSDGYALNFLIPNGAAIQATPEKVKELETRQKAAAEEKAGREEEWTAIAKKIDGATITIAARANDAGHLYNQLPIELITNGIKSELGIDIPPDAVALNAPIKSIGDSDVQLRFGKRAAKLTVRVIQAS